MFQKFQSKSRPEKLEGEGAFFSTCHPFFLLGYLDWKVALPWPEISTVEMNLIPKWFPKKTPTNIPSISKTKQKKYSFIASNCLLIRVSCVCFHSGYVGKIYGVFPKVCLVNGQAKSFAAPPKKGLLWKNSFLGCQKKKLYKT